MRDFRRDADVGLDVVFQLLRRGVTVRRELLLDLVLCAWSDDYYDMWEVRGVEVED